MSTFFPGIDSQPCVHAFLIVALALGLSNGSDSAAIRRMSAFPNDNSLRLTPWRINKHPEYLPKKQPSLELLQREFSEGSLDDTNDVAPDNLDQMLEDYADRIENPADAFKLPLPVADKLAETGFMSECSNLDHCKEKIMDYIGFVYKLMNAGRRRK